MIRLKAPFNYGGVLIEPGRVINFLPVDVQQRLVESGAADLVDAKTDATQDKSKALGEITKDTSKAVMLEYAKLMNIDGIDEKMTKAEIFERIKQVIGDDNAQP